MKQILNVHGRLCKVAIIALTLMFTASFAEVSLNVGIDARMRGVFNGGVNSLRSDYYDTGKVTLGATIDNVTATVVLSRNSDSATGSQGGTTVNTFGNFIKLDSFTLAVNDLFSGLLSMKLYNWGFGAGKSVFDDNQLLSDIDLVGAYVNVQPVDIFGFGLGYGVHGLSRVGSNNGRNTIHAIKFNASIGGPVPVNVYVGATMTHGFTAVLQQAQPAAGAQPALPLVTRKRPFGVERMQFGVDADLYQGWIKASVGVTLPLGAAVSYIASPTSTDVKRDFVVVGGVDGTIPFGDTGLSLTYGAYYVTEAFAKALPNATDNQLHDNLDDVMFKAGIKPKYSLGIFAISLEVQAFMREVWNTEADLAATINPATAVDNLIAAGVINQGSGAQFTANSGVGGYVKPTDKPKKPLGIKVEPVLSITFAPGMSLDLLYTLVVTGLSDRPEGVSDPTIEHTIGMNVKAAFGYTAE